MMTDDHAHTTHGVHDSEIRDKTQETRDDKYHIRELKAEKSHAQDVHDAVHMHACVSTHAHTLTNIAYRRLQMSYKYPFEYQRVLSTLLDRTNMYTSDGHGRRNFPLFSSFNSVPVPFSPLFPLFSSFNSVPEMADGIFFSCFQFCILFSFPCQ